MNKYDKMLALDKETSKEKAELARKTILEMVADGEKVTVSKLITKTGLSQGVFYGKGNDKNIKSLYNSKMNDRMKREAIP